MIWYTYPNMERLRVESASILPQEYLHEGPLLHELVIPNEGLFQVARHEVMHGLVNPENVLQISAYPMGNALGWTLLRESTDIQTAAGIVHGEGYGSDMMKIAYHALARGESPEGVISSAVWQARMKLSLYNPKIIDLVAKGLAHLGRVATGDEFRNLLKQAELEIQYKEEFGTLPERQKINTQNEGMDELSHYPSIPTEGKYILTVYTPDGYFDRRYKDGELVEEIFVSIEDEDDEEKLFGKRIQKDITVFQYKQD